MVLATQSGNFKAVPLPEPQSTVARCYSLIDIGTVPNIYKNQLIGVIKKVNITFELPLLKAVFKEEQGEMPFVVGIEFTNSISEQANLSKFIGQWRNKPITPQERAAGFDLDQMVGKAGYLSFIIKKKSKYKETIIQPADITNENHVTEMGGIMPKPKEMQCPPAINPAMIWDWKKDGEVGFNAEKFMLIPRWLRIKMMQSEEFKKFGHDPEAAVQQGTTAGQPQAAAPEANAEPEPMDTDGW